MPSPKLRSGAGLERIVRRLQRAGKRVVFTNGCFDLLHIGHVRYLRRARAMGDLLIVGVNSDRSVRRLKGPGRPLAPAASRAEVLAALESVDYVTVFSEPDPHRIIARLTPDVLVKGGDWPHDRIVGRDIVEGRGGRVRTIPVTKGASTSRLVAKIIRQDWRRPWRRPWRQPRRRS